MNVLELARRHVDLKKAASTKGGEYWGPCPGCGGTDRFHVWPEGNEGQGSYWCRQCGKGGDGIQFLRDFEGLSFRDACARLGRNVPDSKDLGAPRSTRQKSWKPKEGEAPGGLRDPGLWRERAWKFVSWAFDQLFESREALDYLKQRGIKEETVARFGLGWNPGKKGKDLYRDREAWGLSPLVNEKGKRRPLWLPVGMVIPSFFQMEIERIRIRRPGKNLDFGPRYYVAPGSSMSAMIVDQGLADNARNVFMIVESELDAVLVAQEAGDMAGVVGLGSASSKPDIRAVGMLKRCAHIMVALDFDKAGAEAWRWWKKNFPDCERWPVPKGKDPGEAHQAGVDLREWIRAGLPPGLK